MVDGQLFNNVSMLMSVSKENGLTTSTVSVHLQEASGLETIVYTTLQKVQQIMLFFSILLMQLEQNTSLRSQISVLKMKTQATHFELELTLI